MMDNCFAIGSFSLDPAFHKSQVLILLPSGFEECKTRDSVLPFRLFQFSTSFTQTPQGMLFGFRCYRSILVL